MDVFYKCDPEKNYLCPKTSCFINGGPCFQTRTKEFAADVDHVRLVMPLEESMLDGVPGTRKLRREMARKAKKKKEKRDEFAE